MKRFGDVLKELRTERQLTQEELAKAFDTGKSSICAYEKNERMPDAERVSDYADYFEVSLDYIMGKTNIRYSPGEKEQILQELQKYNVEQIGIIEEVARSGVDIQLLRRLLKAVQEQG
jgi:transcriptional regulator with XRE-family HTH domain